MKSAMRGFLLACLLPLAGSVPASALQSVGSTHEARAAFQLAVVPNLFSDDVSVLDTSLHVEVARIPVGPRPLLVAMSADGAFAYVGEDGSGAPPMRVLQIDLAARAVVASVVLPDRPFAGFLTELEVSADGRWLAAGDISGSTLHLIDTSDMSLAATQVLCAECTGSAAPAYASLNAVFAKDSSFLWAATPWTQELVAVAVPSGNVLGRAPAPFSGGSSPYGDVRVFTDRLPLVVATLISQVRIAEGFSGAFTDIELPGGLFPKDVELVSELARLATTSVASDPFPDFMPVVDFAARVVHEIPAPEAWENLDYTPSRHEVWAKGDFGSSAEIFDLLALTRGPSIPLSLSSIGTHPSFTPDEAFYYWPATNDEIVVVDAATRQVVTTIPVGTNPRGVYMQGDADSKEY